MSDMMKCQNCGAPLRPTAKICVSCGTMVAAAAAPEVQSAAPVEEVAQPETAAPAIAVTPENASPAPEQAPTPSTTPPAATPAFESAPDGIYMKQAGVASAEPAITTGTAAAAGRKSVWPVAAALIIVAGIAIGYWQSQGDAPSQPVESDTAAEQGNSTAAAPAESAQLPASGSAAGTITESTPTSAAAETPPAEVIQDVTGQTDTSSRDVAEAEARAAAEAAEAKARARHEEKLLALRQQQEEQDRRAEELRKAREDMEAAKRQRELEQARQAAALREAQTREQAQNNTAAATQSGEDTTSAAPAAGGAYKEKFRGAFGMVVAKRAYPTKDMANRAQEMWRRERKILEPDGSITVMQEESKEPSVIPGQ